MTMDTAGKAVLFSGVTVLISLSRGDARPEPGVPLDGARDHARRHLRARRDADAAARRAREARPEGRQALAAAGRTPASTARRASPRWGERLWRHPLVYGAVALAILVALALPVTQLKTAMPSIKVVPTARLLADRLHAGAGRVRPRRARPAADRRARAPGRRGRAQSRGAIPGIAARHAGPDRAGGYALITAIPKQDPSNPAVGSTIDRLRAALPAGIAGRRRGRREPRPRRARSSAKTPLVIGVVLGARLPAAADRAAGAADRRASACSPTCSPPAPPSASPGWIFQNGHAALAARLPVAGLPRRLGAGVLLRDDLRDLDGLHRVPALLRQGALGPHPRPARRR